MCGGLCCACVPLAFTQVSQRLYVEGHQEERAGDEEAGANPLPGPSAHEQTGRGQREGMHVLHILAVSLLK